jgi:hypothetical protein
MVGLSYDHPSYAILTRTRHRGGAWQVDNLAKAERQAASDCRIQVSSPNRGKERCACKKTCIHFHFFQLLVSWATPGRRSVACATCDSEVVKYRNHLFHWKTPSIYNHACLPIIFLHPIWVPHACVQNAVHACTWFRMLNYFLFSAHAFSCVNNIVATHSVTH